MSIVNRNDSLAHILETNASVRKSRVHAGVEQRPICMKWPISGALSYLVSDEMSMVSCTRCQTKLLRMAELIAIQPDATDENKEALKKLTKLWGVLL